MNEYFVNRAELQYSIYKIEASSKEEAIEKVNRNLGEFVGKTDPANMLTRFWHAEKLEDKKDLA